MTPTVSTPPGSVASATGPKGVVRTFIGSTIGAKMLMGLTGLGLIGFLVVHMIGNLQVFLGPEVINKYAFNLKDQPLLLWPARLGLLGMFVLHVGLAFHLNARNGAGRPVKYEFERTVQASWASRHMLLTGAVVLAFVGFHLAHFTLGVTHPAHFALRDALGRHDVHGMVVRGFQDPVVAGGYVLAMSLLAVHLSHGFGSLWRSFGVSHAAFADLARKASIGLAVFLAVGFSAVPIAIVAGLVRVSGGAQ